MSVNNGPARPPCKTLPRRSIYSRTVSRLLNTHFGSNVIGTYGVWWWYAGAHDGGTAGMAKRTVKLWTSAMSWFSSRVILQDNPIWTYKGTCIWIWFMIFWLEASDLPLLSIHAECSGWAKYTWNNNFGTGISLRDTVESRTEERRLEIVIISIITSKMYKWGCNGSII